MKLKNFLKLYVATSGEIITITYFDYDCKFKHKAQKFEINNIPENYLNAEVKCFCAFINSISVNIEFKEIKQ